VSVGGRVETRICVRRSMPPTCRDKWLHVGQGHKTSLRPDESRARKGMIYIRSIPSRAGVDCEVRGQRARPIGCGLPSDDGCRRAPRCLSTTAQPVSPVQRAACGSSERPGSRALRGAQPTPGSTPDEIGATIRSVGVALENELKNPSASETDLNEIGSRLGRLANLIYAYNVEMLALMQGGTFDAARRPATPMTKPG
jgi:hypothetical protein